MKKLLILTFLLLSAAGLSAQVILPESGVLAGRLDSERSLFGDEFLFFPPFMGEVSPAGQSFLQGWIEIRFAAPQGPLAQFTLTFHGLGTDEAIEFTGGQRYEIADNTADENPLPFGSPLLASGGVLNLVTGEIEAIAVFPAFRNSIIARVARLNRAAFGFPGSFPPPELPPGFPPLEFPPGFISTEAEFLYADDGRITGFEFHGLTVLPAALLGPLGPMLGFPPFAFGPGGEFLFPVPDDCAPGTPPENCPAAGDNPDGIALNPEALFHPNLDLVSTELEEVPPARVIPPCAPLRRFSGAATAAVGGRLYHFGGHRGDRVTGRVVVYDAAANAWHEGPRMPIPVTGARAAAIGHRIYVVGGRWRRWGPAVTTVQVLNTRRERWDVAVPPLPLPVTDAAMAAVDGRLYVIGGRTNGSPEGTLRYTGAVQRYNPATRRWRQMAPAPFRRDGAAAAVVDGEIYVLGGRSPGRRLPVEVYAYDAAGRSFRAAPPLLWGVYEAAAGVVDGRVFLTGGRREIQGPSTAGVQVLEPGRDAWREAHPQPLPTAASGGAVVGGELFVVGGRVKVGYDNLPTAAVQVLDPARGWVACDSQPHFTSATVYNSASLSVGPAAVSPGSLATLTGFNFAAEMGAAPAHPGPGLPTTLRGVSLTVDGWPAPVLFVGSRRVEFQVPPEVAAGRARLELHKEGSPQQAPTVTIEVAETAPGIFIQSCGETEAALYLDGSSAIACNADGTLNYAANAAPPGTAVTLQMTGLEPGLPLPEVTIDGLPAEVLSVDPAAGEVGVVDVEVVVPPGSRIASRVPVEVTAEGVTSNRAALAVGLPVTAEPLPCLRPSAPLVRTCLPGGM